MVSEYDGQRSLQDIVTATAHHLHCTDGQIASKVPHWLSALLETRVIALEHGILAGEFTHVLD